MHTHTHTHTNSPLWWLLKLFWQGHELQTINKRCAHHHDTTHVQFIYFHQIEIKIITPSYQASSVYEASEKRSPFSGPGCEILTSLLYLTFNDLTIKAEQEIVEIAIRSVSLTLGKSVPRRRGETHTFSRSEGLARALSLMESDCGWSFVLQRPSKRRLAAVTHKCQTNTSSGSSG